MSIYPEWLGQEQVIGSEEVTYISETKASFRSSPNITQFKTTVPTVVFTKKEKSITFVSTPINTKFNSTQVSDKF